MTTRRTTLLGIAGLLLARPEARGLDDPRPFDPTDRYDRRRIEGWPVLVNKGLLSGKPELADKALTLLGAQLRQIVERVQAAPVRKLKTVRIWVEENEPHHPCMTYHPDAGWLRDHGMNPEKARCVELSNARTFLSWIDKQPWMVLHELAHSYHNQFLPQGFQNPEVKAAFKAAMAAGLYDSVDRIGEKKQRAYAATNPMEYFAETTEAYFGKNDFFPFDRPELERHDPKMAALLARIWGEPRADRRSSP